MIVFVGIQIIPTTPNHGQTNSKSDFMLIFNVPNDVKAHIQTACFDCHSNTTNYPWYSHIQPAAWFMESHIKEGKEELNFSDFGNYSKYRQKSKLKAIINQLHDNGMPLWSYTLIHKEALLSDSEKALIIDFMEKKLDSLQ